MSTGPLIAAATALVLVLVGAGCESTQDKSARLAEEGAGVAADQKGLRITAKSRDVKVQHALVLNDRNGSAVVVELRNTSKHTQAGVPIAINVLKGGKSTFRNDAPGLEPSLVGVGSLRPGQSMAWVHDQVFVPGNKVEAIVGKTRGRAPRELPEVDLTPPRIGGDPTSGVAVEGKATNRSDVMQRDLVIYAVARKGGKVVAAGRGLIERLRPGKPTAYKIFFIGNPKGAKVDLAAPPTSFE